MRSLVQSICIAAALSGFVTTASARPLVGTSDEALFISSTMVQDQNGVPSALCLHTKTWRAFSVPFYRTAEGPALSPAVCEVNSLRPLNSDQVAQGLPGVRPWILAKAGSLSPLQMFQGFWGWVLLPLLLIPVWVARGFARKETAGRAVLLETMDPYTQTLAEMLGLIAGENGRLTRQQFARIRAIVTEKTGEDVSQEEVIELALPADRPLSDVDLTGIGAALTPMQRINVADAVQKMVAETPNTGPQIERFALRLFDALGIPADPATAQNDAPVERGSFYPAPTPAE